jgi:hypothetical protein
MAEEEEEEEEEFHCEVLNLNLAPSLTMHSFFMCYLRS